MYVNNLSWRIQMSLNKPIVLTVSVVRSNFLTDDLNIPLEAGVVNT